MPGEVYIACRCCPDDEFRRTMVYVDCSEENWNLVLRFGRAPNWNTVEWHSMRGHDLIVRLPGPTQAHLDDEGRPVIPSEMLWRPWWRWTAHLAVAILSRVPVGPPPPLRRVIPPGRN